MEARADSIVAISPRAWRLTALLAVAAAVIASIALVAGVRGHGAAPSAFAGAVTYFQFGRDADTLWLVDATKPSHKRRLLQVPHAPEFGVVSSLSPDGRSFLYTVLPPDTLQPSPDSPAELWLAALSGESTPHKLAAGLDLLVRPLWSPRGDLAIVRQSSGSAGFELLAVDVQSGSTQDLVESQAALFPVGFTPDGALLYVEIDQDGSRLYKIDLASAESQQLALLSPNLTRDWALSPDGAKLAFLALARSTAGIASQALVFDLRTGHTSAAGDPGADAFSPTWDPEGELALGNLRSGKGGSVSIGAGLLAGPARGFDVPLGFGPGGLLAVRSFDGTTITDPGGESLAVINAAGKRRTIAAGEVTFLGWSSP